MRVSWTLGTKVPSLHWFARAASQVVILVQAKSATSGSTLVSTMDGSSKTAGYRCAGPCVCVAPVGLLAAYVAQPCTVAPVSSSADQRRPRYL